MAEYHSRFYRIPELTPRQRLQMQNLYLSCYDASSPDIFQGDLETKSEVMTIHYRDELAGFTTYLFYTFFWAGQTTRVIFSGDTIIHPNHWGQHDWALAWLGRMGEFEREAPELPLYWFLIVKGHRTYRFLPIFVNVFYPYWGGERPALRALAAALARDRFGADFDPLRGIISFAQSKGQLARPWAEPSAADRRKEAVRFFLAQNPGYGQGDELVCLCRLQPDNLRPRPRRFFLAVQSHG